MFNYPALWAIGDDFYFHETFGDTIYQVKGQELEPYRVFNFGERHLPKAERGKKEGNEEKLVITYVLETPDLIYSNVQRTFTMISQCTTGFIGNQMKR